MYDYSKRPHICLKVGVCAALIDGKKKSLSYPPIKCKDELLIPAEILNGIKHGGTVSDGGNEYVALSGITGAETFFDTMGLIIIDESKDIHGINRADDTDFMLTLMNEFIFDIERVKMNIDFYAPATTEERAGWKRVGDDFLSRFKAHGAKHPCLYTDAEKLAKIKAIYNGEDSLTKRNITVLVNKAQALSKDEKYKLREDGCGLATPLKNKYDSGDGYDEGGRLCEPESNLWNAVQLAFGYLITDDKILARQAYYICTDLAKWAHWGPGHFLNCAGAAANAATVYDWLHDTWLDMGLDPAEVKRGIYSLGLFTGWLSFVADNCIYPTALHSGWRFKNKPDNWNAVCNCNLLIACLPMLADGADNVINKYSFNNLIELTGATLSSLLQDGLVLKQYAPDGSYIESNSYWSYGTNNLFKAMGAIKVATGTDLGIHHAAGLDRTCYYALNSESADYVGWNYHDGHPSQQETSMFGAFAYVSGDHSLFAVRRDQLERGKPVSIFDIFYDPQVLGIAVPSSDALPLDDYMEGIDALTVRNGWASGSLFAAMIGGTNPPGGSHTQIDSGAFVYHNDGVNWIMDLGADNYNIKGGYFDNNALYRRNAEGNNCLAVKSFPYGQFTGGRGTVIEQAAGKSSPYIMIDNTSIYKDVAKEARRGMLLTDSRSTVIIKDEVTFAEPTTAWWTANYNSADITATLSDDAKQVTMTHKNGASIRITLHGGDRFEITDSYTFLLDGTKSFEGENDRKDISRLVVAFLDVTEINCAVTIERATANSSFDALAPMSEWKKLNA